MAKRKGPKPYSERARVYWLPHSCWYNDAQGKVRDLGRISQAQAVKFCYMNRCILVTDGTLAQA